MNTIPGLVHSGSCTSYKLRACSLCTQQFKGRSLIFQFRGQRLQESCMTCASKSEAIEIKQLYQINK